MNISSKYIRYGACPLKFKKRKRFLVRDIYINPLNLTARCRELHIIFSNSSDPDQRAPSEQGLNCFKCEKNPWNFTTTLENSLEENVGMAGRAKLE